MRNMLLLCALWLVAASTLCAAEQKTPSSLAKSAIAASDLTQPGSKPFHLKARVFEKTNPENHGYDAEIEEYWVAPDKWRRTIRTHEITSTLVVNGTQRGETLTGDYLPNWLRTLVTGMLDPGGQINRINMNLPSDNPVIGGKQFCRRFARTAGIPPVGNQVFYSVCFEDEKLESVGIPGYHVSYTDYRRFAGRQVARKLGEYISPGTELEADITELRELSNADDSLFAVPETAPLRTVEVSEQTLRALATEPLVLHWPPVRGGKTRGVLSVYLSLDRNGRVRESYTLNSDHPDMTEAAQQQLALVPFRTARNEGAAVQVEGILTFAYETEIRDPYPVLSAEEMRGMAVSVQAPHFPDSIAHGTQVNISVQIGEDGTVQTSGSFHTGQKVLDECFTSCYGIIKTWRFKPYLREGRPTVYKTVLNFVVP